MSNNQLIKSILNIFLWKISGINVKDEQLEHISLIFFSLDIFHLDIFGKNDNEWQFLNFI